MYKWRHPAVGSGWVTARPAHGIPRGPPAGCAGRDGVTVGESGRCGPRACVGGVVAHPVERVGPRGRRQRQQQHAQDRDARRHGRQAAGRGRVVTALTDYLVLRGLLCVQLVGAGRFSRDGCVQRASLDAGRAWRMQRLEYSQANYVTLRRWHSGTPCNLCHQPDPLRTQAEARPLSHFAWGRCTEGHTFAGFDLQNLISNDVLHHSGQ